MASTQGVRAETAAVGCRDVATYGSLALDGSAPIGAAVEIGRHLRGCEGCSNYVDQMAKSRAVVGVATGPRRMSIQGSHDPRQGAGRDSRPRYSPVELTEDHGYLTTLARATDPAHADDLVQETWNHFLAASPGKLPDRAALAGYLLERAREHVHNDDVDGQAWADDLVRHHPHHTADALTADVPDDRSGQADWRALADLDVLDPDGDSAELYLPDLYADGPDTATWASPPVAWPALTRMLGPTEEAETAELYSVVDAALDELPPALGDAVYLVDVEGHSLETAASLLNSSVTAVRRDLVRARNHVRGRLSAYLVGH